MPKFQINYIADVQPEVVSANDFALVNEWYVFTDSLGKVAQIRANEVHRVDRLEA